jgi:Lar family restriction alleviation protein
MKSITYALVSNEAARLSPPIGTKEEDSMDELKPCPFCGGEAKNVSAGVAGPSNRWHAGDPIFAVNCIKCGASVPNRYRNDLVVEAWNRRAAASLQESRDV